MFEAALDGLVGVLMPQGLGFMALGVLIGSLVGFLPGIGGPAALAILLPFTFTMEPFLAIALLVGLDAVGNTANTFPSVMISVPGGAGSQATILDGYPMAKKGEATRALSAAFVASLLGGIFGALVLLVSLPVLRPLVLSLGTPELFVFTIWGLSMVGVLSGRAPLKGLMAGILGVLIATVGMDVKSGVPRFVFGQPYLWDGIHLVIVALGIFGIPEVIDMAIRRTSIAEAQPMGGGWWEGIKDVFRHWWLMLRSAAVGAWVGFLPGLGSSVADWFAYAHAVQTEKNSENFGKGDIRGVIAPEASNNAKEGGSYIPTLAFGIPGGSSTALILIAFITIGIKPGPEMLTTHLDFTFAVIWTLVIANIMAASICLGLTKPIARATFLPFHMMVPLILVFIFIGAFAANFNQADLLALMLVSLLGYFMKRFGWPRAPLVVGVVLGSRMEMYLWLSIARYGLEWLLRPGVVVLSLLVLGTLLYPFIQGRRRGRQERPALNLER
jgi:TctA family transporter